MNASADCYYSVLEIEKSATTDEIKKAYRKMSLKWHPDKNKHPSAADKFQKITAAYETLGDAQKKGAYDMMGGGGSNMFGNMRGPQAQAFHSMNINEILRGMHGMQGVHGMASAGNGVHVFNSPGGGVAFSVRHTTLSKPPAIIKTFVMDIRDVLVSSAQPIMIERWVVDGGHKKPETETIYVDISAGIDDGEIIVIKDRGNINGDQVGDIKLIIKVTNNTEFTRDGLNIVYNKHITLRESLCGVSFDIEHLNNKTYTITNKEGDIIPPDYKKIMPKMGITRGDHTGDMVIVFHVKFPTKITPEAAQVIRELDL
jgi:DnaJ-class molecular chaperone